MSSRNVAQRNIRDPEFTSALGPSGSRTSPVELSGMTLQTAILSVTLCPARSGQSNTRGCRRTGSVNLHSRSMPRYPMLGPTPSLRSEWGALKINRSSPRSWGSRPACREAPREIPADAGMSEVFLSRKIQVSADTCAGRYPWTTISGPPARRILSLNPSFRWGRRIKDRFPRKVCDRQL